MKIIHVVAFVALASNAWAYPNYVSAFQTAYPSSVSIQNLPASCQLCHLATGGGANWNGYGLDLRAKVRSGLSIQAALAAVEGLNSDGDSTGATNIQEINAGTQPGWTSTSANLPSGIQGSLDPVSAPPPPGPGTVTVSVAPNIVTVFAGQTVQFTASVSGSTNTTVTWSLNPAVGSLSSTGLYSAPASVATSQTVTVTATSIADATRFGSATVTVAGNSTPLPSPMPSVQGSDVGACGGGWPMAGYDSHNTRYAPETRIGVGNVGRLAVQSIGTMSDSVLPTVTVQGSYAYAPDKAGLFSKIDTRTGRAVWTVRASALTGISTAIIRTGPALCNGLVVVGAWSIDNTSPSTAYVMALRQDSGRLVWKTLVENDKGARIFQSPVVHDGKVYVGVGGVAAEIDALFQPNAPAPTFRGSVVALNLSDGRIVWKTYTIPPGYSGGGVWGHTLAVDAQRSRLYAATGNNFTIPPSAMACIKTLGGDSGFMCQSPQNYVDSILALDLGSGKVIWAKQMIPWDAYTCGPNCPAVPGAPDYDFPVGPQLYTTTINGQQRDVVGAGHKMGAYVALDPDSGDMIWANKIGPGSNLGGIERECAVDGQRVYCPHMNQSAQAVGLIDGTVTQAGYWTAMNAATGAVLWQTANPTGARALAPVTIANGILWVGSLDAKGMIYALDAATGKILWEFATGGSNGGGVSVFNGRIFVGTGYAALGSLIDMGTAGSKVYTFGLAGSSSSDDHE